MIALLFAPWLIVALVAFVRRPAWAGTSVRVVMPLVSVGAATILARRVMVAGPAADGWFGLFRVDALSAFMACSVSIVGACAMVGEALHDLSGSPSDGGNTSVGEESRAQGRFALYGSLFVLAMLTAVTINNVALMWTAIEATTIASAVLIPLRRTKASVEAS